MVVVIPLPAMAPGLIIQFPEGKPLKCTLPVDEKQFGCVIVPIAGADGVEGWGTITMFAVAADEHPMELVTV